MSNFMEEFGGEENLDALNVLMDEVDGGEVAIEPEYAPEIVEELPPEEYVEDPAMVNPNLAPPVEPSVDTAAILAQMQAQQQQQNEAMLNMQTQMQAQQTPQSSEPQLTPEQQQEQAAIAELRERMGLPQMEQENAALKAQLEQQQQISQQQQQVAYQAQVESDINSLKAEFDGFNPDLVARELSIMANEPYLMPNGQPARDAQGNIVSKAHALDNKAGWAQVWNEKFASQHAPKPDPIVAVGNGQSVSSSKDAMSRLKSAENTMDQGQAILDLVAGG